MHDGQGTKHLINFIAAFFTEYRKQHEEEIITLFVHKVCTVY